jgi:hypothetical protein
MKECLEAVANAVFSSKKHNAPGITLPELTTRKMARNSKTLNKT